MRTLLPDPPPPQIETFLADRRRLGQDHRDEVWEGVLHVNPPPSRNHEGISSQLHWLLRPYALAVGLELLGTVGIGVKDNNRVPDLTLQHPADAKPQWQQTAALVVEILSPGDETFAKLPFYAAHKVDEVLIVDPQQRTVQWLTRNDDSYTQADGSRIIDLDASTLQQQIDWP